MQAILVAVLNGDQAVSDLTLSQWDLLIRQARKSMLLGKLYYFIEDEFDLNKVPESVLRYLQSAHVHSTKQYTDLLWEIKHLEKVARQLGFPLVLLKGSAYAIAGLSAARGRIFSDIDLMVDKKNISLTEKQLMLNGWVSSSSDYYDQLYYRKWMHEIPPVHHVFRGSVLDVHHNIIPPTAKKSPDASLLMAQSHPLEGYDFMSALSPLDMIIHSATHLFYDGELDHGLRDLVDLDALIQSNQAMLKFEEKLLLRAFELGLQRPVFYALRYTHLILHTQIPSKVLQDSQRGVPNKALLKLMDFLFLRVLMPDHPSCNDRWTGFARWSLYMRSHWLRMPLSLLIPHLLRKSFLRLTGKEHH
ncbi:MAG: hypothetical protein GQ583_10380 [Methyloprofundus sp.]|nr:hypothetical protein [Methyloprofundus sp.]